MKGVKIINLDLVKSDDRGSIFQFQNRDSSKLLLVKRKKGTVSGGHYHTGKNKMKDPETVIVLDGRFEISLKDLKTLKELRKTYDTPKMFKIDPYIFHEIRALTDIVLLDMNSIDDDDDTVRGSTI